MLHPPGRKGSQEQPMTIQKLIPAAFGVVVLSILPMRANARITDQAAREKATDIVRSELSARMNVKPDQFLSVYRDEMLEHLLALAVGRTGSVFIYEANPSGNEIKRNVVVHHISTDADFMCIIAVDSADGSAYRIHGFGISESLAGFEKLIAVLKVRVSSPDQADALAEFYRKVNPGNHAGLTPILRLMGLKQAAERQCQSREKSFDAGERAFANWWKTAEPMYATLPFQERTIPHGSGYRVEWIVLSSPSEEDCGGAPLRAQLEISPNGQTGGLVFVPVRKD